MMPLLHNNPLHIAYNVLCFQLLIDFSDAIVYAARLKATILLYIIDFPSDRY